MKYLPVGLDVRGKNCVVVGGGFIGARKTKNLANAGANVTVVSPTATDSIKEEVAARRARWIQAEFENKHAEGAFMVVAATDDSVLNERITTTASEHGALVCDASSAERSQLIFGALHEGDDGVNVAVFTDGRDPGTARRTRDLIASLLGTEDSQENRSESD